MGVGRARISHLHLGKCCWGKRGVSTWAHPSGHLMASAKRHGATTGSGGRAAAGPPGGLPKRCCGMANAPGLGGKSQGAQRSQGGSPTERGKAVWAAPGGRGRGAGPTDSTETFNNAGFFYKDSGTSV